MKKLNLNLHYIRYFVHFVISLHYNLVGRSITNRMEFLKIAGLSESNYVELGNIMANEDKLADRIEDIFTYLPNILKCRGTNLLKQRHNARVVLSFLRACAKREQAFIHCAKKGVRMENETKSKQISCYCLVVTPSMGETTNRDTSKVVQ